MKKLVGLIVGVFVFGVGMAYADIDTPLYTVPVQAEIVSPNVTVTPGNPLNFGQLLPDGPDGADVIVQIDVSGVGLSANPAGAQTAADNATAGASAGGNDKPAVLIGDSVRRTAGGFTLTSDLPASVTVVFADKLTLTSDVPEFGPKAKMEIANIGGTNSLSNHDGVMGTLISLSPGESQFFHIGGDLTVEKNQAVGVYSGELEVKIDFQ